jgi:hypothetical protein
LSRSQVEDEGQEKEECVERNRDQDRSCVILKNKFGRCKQYKNKLVFIKQSNLVGSLRIQYSRSKGLGILVAL